MSNSVHEIRDPIHTFVRLDSDERAVVDSLPFQRLRHVHQLALTYLVYPGATHRRFEHSLGVLELASRVFDVVTAPGNIRDDVAERLPPIRDLEKRQHWRRVLRAAALCHDLGHLPFSHAAEKDLLPDGWTHERLTAEIIRSDQMKGLWDAMSPPLPVDQIVKLAVGPEASGLQLSDWEAVLSEILVADAFGVDRMDYLLRDAHHVGVPYGSFDHYRLIDTLRILPSPGKTDQRPSTEPAMGVQEGGRQSAEALLLARYFMYSQVYLHRVRRIYDIHLRDFLAKWLPEGRFPTSPGSFLGLTDNEVAAAIADAAVAPTAPGHDAARRIAQHDHFRVLYERHPSDVSVNPDAAIQVSQWAADRFGDDNVRFDTYKAREESADFPVETRDGRIVPSVTVSDVIARLPPLAIDYVFVRPELKDQATALLEEQRQVIIKPKDEDQ